MLITIATIYASLSALASIFLLAALRLSSQISQQEQLVEVAVIAKELQSNIEFPYFLED